MRIRWKIKHVTLEGEARSRTYGKEMGFDSRLWWKPFLPQRKSDMNGLFTKEGKAGLLQLKQRDIMTTLQLINCD